MRITSPYNHISYGVFILVAALFTLLAACTDVTVPDDLKGRWQTDSPQYAGRYLDISDYLLTFGAGDNNEESYRIVDIHTSETENGTQYQIRYEDSAGEQWDLTFFHLPADGGTIRINHQTDIWKMTETERP